MQHSSIGSRDPLLLIDSLQMALKTQEAIEPAYPPVCSSGASQTAQLATIILPQARLTASRLNGTFYM